MSANNGFPPEKPLVVARRGILRMKPNQHNDKSKNSRASMSNQRSDAGRNTVPHQNRKDKRNSKKSFGRGRGRGRGQKKGGNRNSHRKKNYGKQQRTRYAPIPFRSSDVRVKVLVRSLPSNMTKESFEETFIRPELHTSIDPNYYFVAEQKNDFGRNVDCTTVSRGYIQFPTVGAAQAFIDIVKQPEFIANSPSLSTMKAIDVSIAPFTIVPLKSRVETSTSDDDNIDLIDNEVYKTFLSTRNTGDEKEQTNGNNDETLAKPLTKPLTTETSKTIVENPEAALVTYLIEKEEKEYNLARLRRRERSTRGAGRKTARQRKNDKIQEAVQGILKRNSSSTPNPWAARAAELAKKEIQRAEKLLKKNRRKEKRREKKGKKVKIKKHPKDRCMKAEELIKIIQARNKINKMANTGGDTRQNSSPNTFSPDELL